MKRSHILTIVTGPEKTGPSGNPYRNRAAAYLQAMNNSLTSKAIGVLLALSVSAAGATPDVNSGEYFNQPYLAGIKVVPAWDAGLLGAGVVVADLDSGVRATHVDLVGKIAPGGYDFVNDDDDPDDDEDSITDGHGTASAGIIVGNWNGVGVGGIAPSARVLPVKITDEKNETNGTLISQGVDYAAANPSVRIILLEAVGASTSAEEFNSFVSAVAKGKLIIAPSGNAALAGPFSPASSFAALGGAGLIVGSHNGAGALSPFSNGAQGVETNFITAPGQGVVAAGNRADDAYFRVNGTSMAAPQVAAAAALIWGHSPGLTAAQVAQILKTTATDIGAAGVDSRTGVGALNIEAALAPIGIITAPVEEEDTDDSESSTEDGEESASDDSEASEDSTDSENSGSSGGSSGGGAGVALAALVVGGVGYALIGNSSDLEETLVLDDFGRTYELDLETRVSVRNPGPSAKSVVQELDTEEVGETLIERSDFRVSTVYWADRPKALSPLDDPLADEQSSPARMRIQTTHEGNLHTAFGLNQPLTLFDQSLDTHSTAGQLAGGFRSDAFSNPFFGFTAEGYHGAIAYAPKHGLQSGLSFASVDDGDRYGLQSDTSSVHLGIAGNAFGVGATLGLMEEEGNLLGGASGGALSASRAQTFFTVLRGHLDFAKHWSLIGKYTHGLTFADDYEKSLLSDFSQIESNSWGMGLAGRHVFSRGDQLGFGVSQPLRTIDGDVEVSTPYWDPGRARVGFNSTRTSLVPNGLETSLEFFYRKPLGKRAQFITYMVVREEPLHRKESGPQASVIGVVRWRFGSR